MATTCTTCRWSLRRVCRARGSVLERVQREPRHDLYEAQTGTIVDCTCDRQFPLGQTPADAGASAKEYVDDQLDLIASFIPEQIQTPRMQVTQFTIGALLAARIGLIQNRQCAQTVRGDRVARLVCGSRAHRRGDSCAQCNCFQAIVLKAVDTPRLSKRLCVRPIHRRSQSACAGAQQTLYAGRRHPAPLT